MGLAATAPPITAGAMAREAGVTGMLGGIWPSNDGQGQDVVKSEPPNTTAAMTSSENVSEIPNIGTGSMTPPAGENPVQRRRRSQGQMSRNQVQQQAMDRMSWAAGSLS